MLTFKNLTGKKEVKGFNEEWVIASPTKGELKLTPLAQKKLDIQDGDFAIIVIDDNSEKRTVYIAKGVNAELDLDANGNEQKDDRGRIMYKEGTGFGAVVRNATANSPVVKMTAAAGWIALGGSEEHNTMFNIGEGVEAQVDTERVDEDGNPILHTTTFYPLALAKQVAKQARGGNGEDEDEDVALEDAPAEDTASATSTDSASEFQEELV